ncbi:transmembrane protein 39A-A isoform X2 [Cimex lectularius]|uniref:Transmembrane protein 39A n=1 Tax=Cimex lectularius TaxID=79782 RepID=A0A8I6SAF4_CIMLE|nr:transmembrane protein 39A-A isoform X2 [Cimex lectularius]XP_024083023.1 transmembrane protein 39A-A isoform X2 [Cimex lectularius]
MAGGRRNLNRSGASRQQPLFPSDDKSKVNGQMDGSKVVSPKHMPMPSLPQDGNITFEVIMFFFTCAVTFLQFLHLYRSVWWLPNSYTKFAMNFYLIDPYIVAFILTILTRRILYTVLRRLLLVWTPTHTWPLVEHILRLVLLSLVASILVWCTYYIMRNHRFVKIFYLCYPISIYTTLFGLDVNPFFDVMALPSDLCNYKNRLIGKPFHSCSSIPQAIREEVETLKTDFNNRLKQILFSSMLNAYYAGFVPCCFAQSYLYYDVYWTTQHFTFVWISCFTMYIVHCYPLSYCDTLHRAALHLGKWGKIEGRTCHLPSHIWVDSTLWQQGVFVRHCKELYKSVGISNAAEPGNNTHNRFYSLFINPSVLLCSLVAFQLSLVILQLAILIRTSEWYQLISLSILIFVNYYTLFKLGRDYLICWRLYAAEAMIQDKSNDICVKYKTG